MSGIKRPIQDKDPDYEDISIVHHNKRHKAIETSARDAAIQKIEGIVNEQFSVELKNKEHEIDVIDQRLNEARRMMDKLRACVVANYYASAALTKGQDASAACDATILNHPSIKKFLESPSRASSPANNRSETPSANNSETDSLYAHSEYLDKDGNIDSKASKGVQRAEAKLAKEPVVSDNLTTQSTQFARTEDASRRFVKKTIVVGNVSKYIPPDKREENDQSTHKWMVYVRGSRKEPSIDHFVKKVWFFLHPSYKPNDLVEVSEPPFHLTRRGWGEFPVRVQIHFKDSQNKRIDIIHNLKLDRTYTGLQTLGAETVVEVELHRHSFGEDALFSQSSNESSQSDMGAPSPVLVKTSSPHKGGLESAEKGFSMAPESTYCPHPPSLERTPSKMTQRFTIGAHGSTAFQPITASCKIVAQGQSSSLAESPGKSFQPITMSCKIVSGSPTSKRSGASQVATGTRSPVPKVHGSGLLTPTIKEESLFAAMPPLCPIGSHAKTQSPKTVTGGLGAFTKVIIKQEPVDPSQQQQETPSTSQPSLQQVVTVKGNQMIAVSPQKNLSTSEGSKIVGIPVGSAVPGAMKPSVTISGGQILVAKANPSKVVGQKQMVAQGVAKAVVSGSVTAQALGNLSKAQASNAASTKPGSQGSVMATLQLPATNIANLANLPPGTKLYLTTNSKNPSGKGKLLLIPQGAILRAANTANLQSGMSTGSTSGTGTSTGGLPQHLTYTSYILKQTPQGTFLVGQPSSQASGKQVATNVVVQGNVASSGQGQVLKVSTGQKSSLHTQGTSGSSAQPKISESLLKSLPVTSQTQKPGTTLLRVAGGVITAAGSALPALSGNGPVQSSEASGSQPSHVTSACKSSVQQPVTHVPTHGKLVVASKANTLSAVVSSARTTLSPANTSSALIVKTEPDTALPSSHALPFSILNAPVKMEENMESESSAVKTEHLQNFKELLTATVKKVPLIAEKSEDGYPFCAGTLEQYYSWNIGKRRASEWQRAITMRKMLQEIIEKQPKFSSITPLKTKQVVYWCRVHGYTPTDSENAGEERESIEDVLTRIDNESVLPTTYSSPETLCRNVEELEKLLKKEGEPEEEVDILGTDEEKPQNKKENEEVEDVKFYMMPSPGCEFVRDTAQEIGISLQPIEVLKNIYSSPVEEMILKATEQFVSDILRDALAAGYQMTGRNRAPREITMSNIQQAICSIPLFDFLTNRHMGTLNTDDEVSLK